MIDSTEAHCQAKVLNNTTQQDQSETLLAEGEGLTKNGSDTTIGIHNLCTELLGHYAYLTVIPLENRWFNPVVFF